MLTSRYYRGGHKTNSTKYRIFPNRSPGFYCFFHNFFSYKPGLLLGRGHYQDGACIIFFTKKIRPKKKNSCQNLPPTQLSTVSKFDTGLLLGRGHYQDRASIFLFQIFFLISPGFYQDGVTIRTWASIWKNTVFVRGKTLC